MTRKAEANAATAPPSAARLGGWLDFSNWSDAAAMGFLILAATLPYLNALFNGFVYVDSSQILNDPYVRSFRYLPEILTTTVWSQVGTITASNYYRPLMTLGYLGCYSLFGELPFGFHLFSVIVNTANVCLLFKLSERMFKDRALAFVAALVFALHPIHTEAVAWNAAVPDLDVTFFLLSAFWFFLGLGQPGDGHFESGHLGMMLSYLGAILSKEPSLLFPLVVTGYEHFYRDDRALTTWKQKLSRYRGIGLLALLYVVFRIWLFGAFAPRLSQLHLTRPQVILTGISLAGEYLWKLLWPAQLSAFYVFHRTGNVIGPRVIGGIGGLLLFGALFLLLRRRGELASFGFVWILLTLAPVLNAPWMGGSVFGERYLYLPSVGFAWLAAWAGVSLWRKAWRYGLRWQRSLAAAALAVAMLCGIRIVARNSVWENDEVLYNSVLAVFPDAYSIRTNLGMVYWQRGHLDAAEREWRRALRQQPDYTQALAGLGLIYLSKADLEMPRRLSGECFKWILATPEPICTWGTSTLIMVCAKGRSWNISR